VQTDPIQQGYQHIGLIKQVLQTQLANLGTVAVSATADQLNAAGAQNANPGVLEIASNGTRAGAELILDGIAKTGTAAAAGKVEFLNVGTIADQGILQVSIDDKNGTLQTVATLDSAGTFTLPGTTSVVNANAIQQGGNPLIPKGVIVMWSGAANAVPAGWQICDGTNGTPDLLNRFIVGAGGSFTVGQTGGAASQIATTNSAGTHITTAARQPLQAPSRPLR
jgi:hypothetical protein